MPMNESQMSNIDNHTRLFCLLALLTVVEGSFVDSDKVWFSSFRGKRFVLVESALMVKEMASLEDAIFPNS
jgi:hypothetical protein